LQANKKLFKGIYCLPLLKMILFPFFGFFPFPGLYMHPVNLSMSFGTENYHSAAISFLCRRASTILCSLQAGKKDFHGISLIQSIKNIYYS
jgi:hypothetical protein